MKHLISVVIPFYSNFAWLEEAIESVLQQTYNNVQIIVINDGSPEDDLDFVSKFKGNMIYEKIRNSGPAAARNKGIDLATGKYVAFLDSDDIWFSSKLEVQVKLMELNGYKWSHTGYETFNSENLKAVRKIDNKDFNSNVFLRCFQSAAIATPCVMVRRDVFEKDKELRFAENMRYGQDTFLWINLARYYELGIIPRTLVKVRMRGTNAATRARVHLSIKSKLYFFIRKKSCEDMVYKEIPTRIRVAYQLSTIGDILLSFLEKNKIIKNRVGELLSKVLYLPTYFILKAGRK